MYVSVIGAGVGGMAMAGFAALRGHKVAIYDIREGALAPLRAQHGIYMHGKVEGFAPLTMATDDPAAAIADANLVIIVVPGPDQCAAAAALAPHLRDQMVVVTPACTGGALAVTEVFSSTGCGSTVAETDSFIFGCAVLSPGHSTITAIKNTVGVAALPASNTQTFVDALAPIYPAVRPAESVLHTGLTNMNAVAHVGPMVANAGRIESGEKFDYYGDGITSSVARIVEAYDRERLDVASAMSVSVPSLLTWIDDSYGICKSGAFEAFQTLHRDVYGPFPAPQNLQHRFLTEDVPCGAVPVASLGRALGVDTPVHDSLIHLASQLCGENFSITGRTVQSLGLQGMSGEQIVQFVTSGISHGTSQGRK